MDSDDEREEETPTWKGIPATVVLINVFDNSRKTASVAHAATCRMIKQYLRTSTNHLIGVSLYGMEDSASTSALSAKNVIDVVPLTAPTLDDFKKLRDLNISAYKPTKEFQLSEVLWHCSKMFTNCKKLLSVRTVILLTRMDVAPVTADQKPTLKRVVDLVDANITIKIINISEVEYKIDPFYDTFLIEAHKGNIVNPPIPIWNDAEIAKLMHQQSHRHLAVSRLDLEIGDGVFIGVGVYNLLIRSSQYQHKKVDLDRDSNAILSTVTKTMKVTSEPSNDIVLPMDVDGEESEPKQVPMLKSEILFYQEYGGERVEFAENEMKKLKNPFGPPKMKLLGFKPSSLICKEKWFLKSGYFLFPNENSIEGSTVAFKAMHQACVETGMVGICVLCSRVNSYPTIVALCPCTHPLGLDVDIGFDVVQLPFVENVRNIPVEEEDTVSNISQEQRTLVEDIITSLKFDYKPDMFENPKLQSEYRAVEAIALDEEDLDPFVDTTKPNMETFERLPASMFEELFGPFLQTVPKRPTISNEKGASSRKKIKENLDKSLVQERIKNKTVNNFKVAELKEILQSLSNPAMPALTGLKKQELVDLVYKYWS